ncbi:MAG TPA: helix-turn-helix domain-containing protein [Thermoanaerobaculia bacterium]|nr:helix-turn-helix domain-containing protein [Thermoanaerobaculia bacterium]
MANSSSIAGSNRQLPKDLRIGLGCRILERRRLLRWSQQRLAETIGLQAIRVSKIENGHVSPSLAEAVRLARGLKISLDELVFGASGALAADEARPKADPAEGNLRAQARTLEAVGSSDEIEVVADLLRKLIADRKATPSARARR